MGTRADFYIGEGKDATWLGSSAYDGYEIDGMEAVQSEDQFRAVVEARTSEDDGTKPDMGWPWPWKDSCTTDYAYCWCDGAVKIFCFGKRTRLTDGEWLTGEEEHEFPDMSERRKVASGNRSGILMVSLSLKSDDASLPNSDNEVKV